MPNYAISVERDNQNSLRKFPFADCASCTNGACTILPGAIIDAQLYIPGRNPGKVWLSSVGTDGKLRFSDDDGEFAETSLPITAGSAVPVTFTGSGGPLPGGVIVFGNGAQVAELRSLGGQEFTADSTELVPAVLSWPGLPGVSGFLLDDGNTVYGAVRIKGANGCEVSTYVGSDNVRRLRISAVGETVATTTTTGFVTKVVVDSDNTHFTVSKTRSDYVVDILPTGVASLQDEGLNANQDTVCAAVKKARGTTPSTVATAAEECNPCSTGIRNARTITFKNNLDTIGPVMNIFEGDDFGSLGSGNIPANSLRPGYRFAGYYDKPENATSTDGMRLYYRYDGTGVGKFTEKKNVTLYAHWISAASQAEVSFSGGYGTLHLAAPDLATYTNPMRISGVSDPIPKVKEVSDDAIVNGEGDALSELILHPSVPSGTVVLGIRGLDKAYTL